MFDENFGKQTGPPTLSLLLPGEGCRPFKKADYRGSISDGAAGHF
jgi:hypothetical protein